MQTNQKKVVKVCYQGETKRLKVTQDYANRVDQTHKAFNGQLPSSYKFYYLDEDNEMISISSQNDFVEALGIEDLNTLKLTVAASVMEAREMLFQQISDTQSIRDTLNQSGFFAQPSPCLSRASTLNLKQQETLPMQEAPATERVRNIMKSIDSDFEDLEPSQSSKPVSTQPQREAQKMTEPVSELTKAVAPQEQEVSEEEFIEQEAPYKLEDIMPLVRDEVRSFCKTTFTGLLKDHIKNRNDEQAKVIHHGIVCDGCNCDPITGIRDKSAVDHDYDLCEKCEAAGVHKKGPMLKIRTPAQAPANIVCQFRNAEVSHPPQMEQQNVQTVPRLNENNPDLRKFKEKMMSQMNSTSASESLGKKFAEQLAQPVPQQQPKARGFGTKPKEAKKFIKYSARFVRESFGDRHPVLANATFAKQWTMRNDGKHEWPEDTTLIMTNGDEMQAMPTHIGVVRPDEETTFSVPLVAPSMPGRYSTYFRMRTGENYRFGHKIWCDILVSEPEKKVVAQPDAVKMVPQQPVNLLDNQYPSLDIELGDKSGNSDNEPSNGVPQVEAPDAEERVSAFAEPTEPVESVEAPLNLSTSSMMTPKQVYFSKMNSQVPEETIKSNLTALFEMGFTNFEVNKGMLSKYNNNLEHVSNLLCEGLMTESCINAVFNK